MKSEVSFSLATISKYGEKGYADETTEWQFILRFQVRIVARMTIEGMAP